MLSLKGSLEERGIVAWNAQHDVIADEPVLDEEVATGQRVKSKPGLEVYDFPIGMGLIKRFTISNNFNARKQIKSRDCFVGNLYLPRLDLFLCDSPRRQLVF